MKMAEAKRDIDLRLREIAVGMKRLQDRTRRQHLRLYDRLLQEYKDVPDEAMPHVFAEFQRSFGTRFHCCSIPHETPEEMRDYLAKVRSVFEISSSRSYRPF